MLGILEGMETDAMSVGSHQRMGGNSLSVGAFQRTHTDRHAKTTVIPFLREQRSSQVQWGKVADAVLKPKPLSQKGYQPQVENAASCAKVASLQVTIEEKTRAIRALQRNYQALSHLCAAQCAKMKNMSRELERTQKSADNEKEDSAALKSALYRAQESWKETERLKHCLKDAENKTRDLQSQLHEREAQIKIMDSAEDGYMEQLRLAHAAREHVETQLKVVSRNLEKHLTISTNNSDSLTKRLDEQEKKMREMGLKLHKDQENIACLSGDKNRALNKLRRFELELKNAKHELRQSRGEASRLRKQLEEVQADNNKCSDEKMKLETNIKGLEMRMKTANRNIIELSTALRDMDKERSKYLREKDSFKEKEASRRTSQLSPNSHLESREQKQAYDALARENNSIKQRFNAATTELHATKRELMKIQASQAQLQADFDEQVAETDKLKSYEGFAKAKIRRYEESTKLMEIELQDLKNAQMSSKPVGWSQRMALHVSQISEQHQLVQHLEDRLHRANQEIKDLKQVKSNPDLPEVKEEELKYLEALNTLYKAEKSRSGDYTCSKCKKIFKNPVTGTCGHSFCKKCVSNVKYCPRCKSMRKPFKHIKNRTLDQLCREHASRMRTLQKVLN